MWALVSIYQLYDDVEGGLQSFNRALGDLKEPGLERAELLVDRATGKALTITVWAAKSRSRRVSRPPTVSGTTPRRLPVCRSSTSPTTRSSNASSR